VRDADQAGQSGIPRGLELILESPDGAVELDTIVMANLGYAQFLPPSPGLYRLRIRDGRSKELYEMRSVGNLGWESPSVEVTGTDITLTSLHGLTIYPQVRRREGQENESLIEDLDLGAVPEPEAERGAAGYLRIAKNFFGGLKQQAERVKPVRPASDGANADINIFTVASGHLYERMASIMVLSVLKHTQSSVKFWFIENELSPSFKAFLPHLAAEYGFRYELITYAWPHWLRSQREKQRRIWGYKSLFLDVLFPLDLKKVIFVDADQIVRVDLQELVDTNLQGGENGRHTLCMRRADLFSTAPYGYPPMGDDRPEVEGFRFWKQGYWKTFLRGKPYHISALYVVDLARFRRVAAGDQLRGQYQQLSSDPGSLANLDQE
jgi:UDP-glucose:glycoprotein glucosyltransferase